MKDSRHDVEETNFYDGPPTVEVPDEDKDWFEGCQLGRVDLDENNDLSGGAEDDPQE